MKLSFLKGEKARDRLRWGGAFIAVVLVYSGAAWLILRQPGSRDVNGPVLEIDLPEMPRLAGLPPARETASEAKPALPTGEQDGNASRPANPGDQSATGAKEAAAVDKAERPLAVAPGAPAQAPSEKNETATDSSGGGGRSPAPLRAGTPEGGVASSIWRTPIDTSMVVNRGRASLRSARGGPVFRGVASLQRRPMQPLGQSPLAAAREPNSPFGAKPNPIASALTLSNGHAANTGPKVAVAPDGGLPRNAIGVVIDQRATALHAAAAASAGMHSLSGTPSVALQTTGHMPGEQHGANSFGAPVTANAKPGEARLASGAVGPVPATSPTANHEAAVHASQIASIGGATINGAGPVKPFSTTGAIGGPAKAVAGVINGSSFRPRY